MKKVAFIIAGFIISIPLIGSQQAEALSCLADAQNIEWHRERNQVIFRGTVTERTDHRSEDPAGRSTVKFKVIEYWKGNPGERITVESPTYAWEMWAGNQNRNGNQYFQVGQEYVVFATREATGTYRTYLDCSMNFKTSDVADELEDYVDMQLDKLGDGTRPGQGPAPEPTSRPEPTNPDEPVISVNLFTRDLQMGDSGDSVASLQTILEQKGFLTMPAGVAKGYFGAMTRDALARYQASVGITPAQGYFGPKTRARISAPEITPGYCLYEGRPYKVGEGFKAADGCNTCSCTATGQVACTLMACLPQN
jgi:hypothetical protein